MDSRPDSAAQAALAADVRRPVTFAYLDLKGEPIRVTDAPYSFTFSGTGDEDLDGFTFDAVDPRVVSVGPVKAKEGGTDTLTLQLSGLAGVDDELMTQIGDRSNWAGRDCRLWRAMLDPQNLTRIGAIWSYYTGYMSVPKITGDRTGQVINLSVESYLAFFGQASNRTYLDQQGYDPGDTSAALAIAIANGASKRT
ncbi:hypothetical protein KCP91_08135 [Microvirga sp. SRT01]|uniref:Uncharacterized protein n=1 Tax=Sphingomonas longa TaxID=2778730 RepID=A0ABS2D5Z5_9SPHN|nr:MULTISPECIES: hypothetical protein [Alphaproteobacteria]MBM6576339.1 hypothetical protein [Sphingomonas sp. BT552]MBR7709385.1 hypothetical protein [Microvirga sp. SRT01]